MVDDYILKEKPAAAICGVSVHSFRAWRLKGHGPDFLKIGRSVRYRHADLMDFLRKCHRTPAAVISRRASKADLRTERTTSTGQRRFKRTPEYVAALALDHLLEVSLGEKS